MTESDAKTKWCPMVQISHGKGAGVTNRGEKGNVGLECIASDCMMWVWSEYEDVGDKMIPSLPVGGHCGLTK